MNLIKKKSIEQQELPVKTTKKQSKLYEGIIMSCIVSFAILAFLAKQNPYFGLDLYITNTIQQISFPGFNSLMELLTLLGNYELEFLTITLVLIGFVTIKKNYEAIFYLLSVSGTYFVGILFKDLIGRSRPDPNLIHQIDFFSFHDSFPSGHVLYYIGSFGFLLFLTFARLKKGLLRSSLVAILLFLLVGISISRIYLGAHWFSDTLGAYLIGTVWLYITIHLYLKILKRS